MTGKHRLTKSIKGLDITKQDKPKQIRGILGNTIGGNQVVEIPTRAGYVWVRLRDQQSEIIQAFNDNVSPVYDLPVFVTRDSDDPTRYIVQGRDTAQYQNWGAGSAYLPRHANQHSFSDDAGAAGDVVWVYGRQFMPFLGYPSGSSGAGNIIVSPYTFYSQNGTWIYSGGTGTSSIVTYKPTGSNARVVLVYVDEYGNPQVSPGSYFAASITGTSQVINYLPALPSGSFPISAVRLLSGTSVITWQNIYDLRPFYSESISVLGGTQGGSAGIPERSLPIYDDHVFKTTGTIIDFTDNISVVVTGSVAFVSSSGGGGGGSSVLVYDDHVFKATGTALDFTDNISVAVTGSFIYVSSTASSSSTGTVIGARVYNTSGTALVGGSWSYIPFYNERWDTDNIHSGSSSQLYCNTAGTYLIVGQGEFTEDHIGTRYVGIFLNRVSGDNTQIAVNSQMAVTGSATIMGVATVYQLNVGDYVEFGMLPDITLGPPNSSNTPNRATEFMMQKIDGGGSTTTIAQSSVVFPIFDNSVFKITGTAISFDDNLSVVVTGTVAFVSSAASGGGLSALPIQDDSVFVVSGTAISFDKDLIVTASGTVAHVEITANTFASGSHTHPVGAAAIQIYEDNVFQATGSLIGFNDRLAVAVTGTSAYIRVTERDSSIILDVDRQLLVGGDVASILTSFSKIGMQETSNPVVSPGSEDVNIREMGNILYEPHEATRRYKTTYTGYSGTYPGTEHVFYAYSEDGKTWTKNSVNPIITARLSEDPFVIREKDIYYLFCEDKSHPTADQIRRYHSTDFENWTDDGQITGLDGAQSPVVWKENGTWYLLYEHYVDDPHDTRLATSSNGFDWTPYGGNPVIATGTFAWNSAASVPQDIKKIDGTYFLSYTGESGTTWSASLATSTNLINWTDSGKAPIKDDTNANVGDLIMLYDTRLSFLYNRIGTEGMFRGYPLPPTLSLSNDAVTITSDWHLLSSQSGNIDNLSSITGTSTGGQFLVLQPNSGHTITLKHATGNIYLNNEQDFDLSGEKSVLLFYDGTNWSDLSPQITGTTGGGTSTPTYPAIYERGSFVATGTAITFDGNVEVSTSGSFVSVLFSTTTYQRVAQPNPLGTITGSMWQTPERVYASGSLAVFLNGLIQTIGSDYIEQFYVSGTYQYLKDVPTGTVHMIMYGIPCIAQTIASTGTTSPFAIMDSNSVLLLDSNSVQILDSNG